MYLGVWTWEEAVLAGALANGWCVENLRPVEKVVGQIAKAKETHGASQLAWTKGRKPVAFNSILVQLRMNQNLTARFVLLQRIPESLQKCQR